MSTVPQCRLFHGDCSLILPLLGADSVDSVVTDPAYGLRFMGKAAILEGFPFLGLELDQTTFKTAFNCCCLVLETDPPEILELEKMAL